MQDSYHPPDIFVLYEKFPLRIESAQSGKQSHVPTWQQGFWKGRDEKKEIPKKKRKMCWREKHLRSAQKPTKIMSRGGFCFPPFLLLDCVPPWRTVSKCGLSNEALRICIWRLKIHSDCSPPGRDSASFAVWLNRARGGHSWKWDLTSRNMTRKRARVMVVVSEMWIFTCTCTKRAEIPT